MLIAGCAREASVREETELTEVDVPVLPLDFLLTVDLSGSMGGDLLHVRDELLVFSRSVDLGPKNFRFGVGFPNPGDSAPNLHPPFGPPVVSPPFVESRVESQIPVTEEGVFDAMAGQLVGEAAWWFISSVVSPELAAVPSDFLDPGVPAIVAVVSDDNDLSEEPREDQFLSWLERRSAASTHFRYHAVIDPLVPVPTCGRANARHLLAAAATGGAVLNLCAPNTWGNQLAALVDEAFDTPTLTSLPSAPCSEATLTLTSGGEPWEACGPYDTGSRSEPCPEWTWDAAAGELWIPLRLRHAPLTATLTRPEGCR